MCTGLKKDYQKVVHVAEEGFTTLQEKLEEFRDFVEKELSSENIADDISDLRNDIKSAFSDLNISVASLKSDLGLLVSTIGDLKNVATSLEKKIEDINNVVKNIPKTSA